MSDGIAVAGQEVKVIRTLTTSAIVPKKTR